MRKCIFKEFVCGEMEEKQGTFLEFGTQIVEAVNDKDNYSFANYTIAIVEDKGGDLHRVQLEDITFLKANQET